MRQRLVSMAFLAFVGAAAGATAFAAAPESRGPSKKPSDIRTLTAAVDAAEKSAHELKALAGAAVKLLATPAKSTPERSVLATALEGQEYKRCMAATRIKTEAKVFAHQPKQVGEALACFAAATRSFSSCDSLPKELAKTEPGSPGPFLACKEAAVKRRFIIAAIDGTGPEICQSLTLMFSSLEAARRLPTCQALLSGQPDACARAVAASGGAVEAKSCRATVSLKGLSDPAGCSALSADFISFCQEAVADRNGGGGQALHARCTAKMAKVLEAHCRPIAQSYVLSKSSEIARQEAIVAKARPQGPMAAVLAKRTEIDAALANVGSILNNLQPMTPAHRDLARRVQATSRSVERTMAVFKTPAKKAPRQ